MPSEKQYFAKNAEFVSTVWCRLAPHDGPKDCQYLATKDFVSNNETGSC